MKHDTIVVIPSRNKDGQGECLSFETMMKEKRAIGFIGAAERITKMKHIAIVDKGNKVFFADITHIELGVDYGKEKNTNDVQFGNVRHVPLSVLTAAGIDVNKGRCSIRYAELKTIVDSLKKEDTELLTLWG
ncbi:hypothetical protein Aeh1ORF039c [Aeromonas phage Aeh1]|uniref:Uncharacterized protein n=1 Tax=Aeromonas phage Aeh1 TaxID=2880362 RepID=Q76Z48_9CAUD|nr:hypothetical protein Aeh1p043 [Aeromonas phage Aeh1]AAQ17698.1 hypothetical protein Aeh1ORF039c [Aeromonas phage Aeh1]